MSSLAMPTSVATPDPAASARPASLRRKLLGGLLVAAALGGGGSYAYGRLFSAGSVTTEDAYVGADTAGVTALTSGIVSRVLVEDAQHVRAGQLLVQLDDQDARLAVRSARAALVRAERGYDEARADDGADDATIAARMADAATAHDTLQRKTDLYAQGWVTRADFVAARDAAAAADAAVQVAREQDVASSTRIAGLTRDQAPDVAAARAQLAEAELALARTKIRAPEYGIVVGRAAESGEQVAPGTLLMSVVPVDRAYVDANFTEKQLTDIRPGQRVQLTSDVYGPAVTYHGRVAGLGGGTGAAFALVPAQNATGNWIKVVQRVPVRIQLTPAELVAHPLRVGLSMKATVETATGRAG